MLYLSKDGFSEISAQAAFVGPPKMPYALESYIPNKGRIERYP